MREKKYKKIEVDLYATIKFDKDDFDEEFEEAVEKGEQALKNYLLDRAVEVFMDEPLAYLKVPRYSFWENK